MHVVCACACLVDVRGQFCEDISKLTSPGEAISLSYLLFKVTGEFTSTVLKSWLQCFDSVLNPLNSLIVTANLSSLPSSPVSESGGYLCFLGISSPPQPFNCSSIMGPVLNFFLNSFLPTHLIQAYPFHRREPSPGRRNRCSLSTL